MCPICQEAKNKWFHRIALELEDVMIQDVRFVCNDAFGPGVFNQLYSDGRVQFGNTTVCSHCAEKFRVGYDLGS